MSKNLFLQNKIIIDIFDELEIIGYLYEDLINKTTIHLREERKERKEQIEKERNEQKEQEIKNDENVKNQILNLNNNENNSNLSSNSSQFISIYDLFNDSYKEPFLPNNLKLLEQLKKYPLRKIGNNKKTHKIEEYSWRNLNDFLTYEEGGRLSELHYEKGGKLANWFLPFFGFYNEDQNLELDNNRKEAKRVACLLCEKLETLQFVRNTLVRHLKNHHHDFCVIFYPNDSYHSTQSSIHIDNCSDTMKLNYWEIITKLIR